MSSTMIGFAWVPREMDWELFNLSDEDDAGVGEDGGRGMRRASAVSGEIGGDVGTGVSMVKMVTFRGEGNEVDESVDRGEDGEVGDRPDWL